ncbi:lipid droplet assembly factor 1-A isoform X1 [Tachysurus fulvidraco]|uniref:lipid droplet assembly factor 1-A isoform X1 n=2 Tax=Tachysurus fulvidraco TaxID=1234273 RepID=UPI001FED70DF|nr:lipid droplet assembly factor 1-A isoform X1 [Tachysurus fulvidraco]XP_026997457.2 lipid droplet assembly factor 1-A isoform X1 [Tachysurus fulvidraco]XP_047657027.1 lipid droplet assembly factor 1-A isoform X1 [Tachysurus fulvidraco]
MEDLNWDPKGQSGPGSSPRNTGPEAGMILGGDRKLESPEDVQSDTWSCVDFTWITEFLNSNVGKYLSDHPFITLVLLVFSLTASVPIGLFLAFSAVTFITVTTYCILVEVFLLIIGGVILLCVLCCLAVVAFWISCVISVLYVISSHVLNYSNIPRTAERTISAGDKKQNTGAQKKT